MLSLEELYCEVDDFYLALQSEIHHLQVGKQENRGRRKRMSDSEVMTIVILFHLLGYRNFKTFYLGYVRRHLQSEFPKALSYTRFVERMPATLVPMCLFLKIQAGRCTGISFIDSTAIPVCHNRRIKRHRVFKEQAKRGKTSMGWFYGFKLHLVVNDKGELLSFMVTAGNVDDRRPVPQLAKDLWGKLFGDKGYLSKALGKEMYEQGLHLFTPLRKDMKNKLMTLEDKLLQRKRSLIETIIDQLKNISQIQHSRHRSLFNFSVNLIAGLIAYTLRPKKPSLHLTDDELASLPALI